MTAKKKVSPIHQLITAPSNWFASIEGILLPIPCFALLESGEVIPLVFDSEKKEMVNALTIEDFDDLLYATDKAPEMGEELEDDEEEIDNEEAEDESESEESSEDEDEDNDEDDDEDEDDDKEKKEE